MKNKKDYEFLNISKLLEKLFDLCYNVSPQGEDDLIWSQYLQIHEFLEFNKVFSKSFISDTLKGFDRINETKLYFSTLCKKIKSLENLAIFQNYDSRGLSIKSVKDFDSDVPLIEIPTSMIIYSDYLTSKPPYSILKSDPLLSSMENVFMSVAIVFEFYNSAESVYWEYLKTLPCTYESIAYFSLRDFEILKNSPSFKPAVLLWISMVRHYAYLHSFLLKISKSTKDYCLKDVFNSRKILNRFCLNDYFWGASVVMTRNFNLPSLINKEKVTLALIPIIDLCNHSFTPSLQVFYEPNQSACLFISSKSIKKDQELLMSYGKRSTSDYVIHNGFIPDLNPDNYVNIEMPFSQRDINRNIKINFMKLSQMKNFSSTVCINHPFEWAGALLAYLVLYSSNYDIIEQLMKIPSHRLLSALSNPSTIGLTGNSDLPAFTLISTLRKTINAIHLSIKGSSLDDLKFSSIIQRNIHSLKLYEINILENALNQMYQLFPTFKL